MPNPIRPMIEHDPINPELVGVFKSLSEQHREMADLLTVMRGDLEQRTTLWATVRQTLFAHEHSEVRELFPILRTYPETRALADHHDGEARGLDALLARLDRMPMQSELWVELFNQLVETVLAHAAEEEARIFPAAQAVLGEARAQQLDATVREARLKIMALR